MSGSKLFRPGPCEICGRVGKLRRGLCGAHYERVRSGRDVNAPIVPMTGTRTDAPAYRAVHTRLVAVRGPASSHACVRCGQVAAHWAFDDQEPSLLDRGHRYSDDLDRYAPMCRMCHLEHEGRRTCFHGPEKERYAWGGCKECHRERSRQTWAAKREQRP